MAKQEEEKPSYVSLLSGGRMPASTCKSSPWGQGEGGRAGMGLAIGSISNFPCYPHVLNTGALYFPFLIAWHFRTSHVAPSCCWAEEM